MDSRAREAIAPDNSRVMIYENEIELKLESICASAFRLLKAQLEEKRDNFKDILTAAENFESTTPYYSTPALQKKLADNCRSALQDPSISHPLHHIKQTHKIEYEEVLKEIDCKYEVIKENIKSNLVVAKTNANLIDKKKPSLKLHLDIFKSDLINALQLAAKESFDFLAKKDEGWTKEKLEALTDVFGCVVRFSRSSAPYDLDNRSGHGPNFGRALRENGTLSRNFMDLPSLKSMKLADIEQMIHKMIAECESYPKLRFYLLKSIKTKLEELSKNKEYQGYLHFEETGLIYSYLTSVSLRKEEQIFDEPLAALKKQHAEVEMKNDGMVAQKIQEVLKPLQDLVETYKINTDKVIGFVNTEVRSAASYLYDNSLASYRDIDSRLSAMLSKNSDATTVSLATEVEAHKVQIAYESAIKSAKMMDQKEFDNQILLADEALVCANNKMSELKPQLHTLENHQISLVEKLTMTKKSFGGDIYRPLRSSFRREAKKLDELKIRFGYVLQAHTHANILPQAILAYGSVHFDGAHAKSKINDSFKQLEVIPVAFEALKDIFNHFIDDLSNNKECKLEAYQQNGQLELLKAKEALKKVADNNVIATESRDKASEKLSKAKTEFPPEVHAEHQDVFDVLDMRFAEMKTQQTLQAKNLAFMQLIPEAMKDYSDIVLNAVKIEEDSNFVTHSCSQLSSHVKDIRQARAEAERLAKAGVVKKSLGVLAETKLKEMAEVLYAAERTLNRADQIRTEEEKKLVEAKCKYPNELHQKTKEFFDQANNHYTLALNDYNATFKSYMDATLDVESLRENLVSAKQTGHEKELATEMRQFLLKVIIMNFSLWKNSRLGGVNYRYDGVDYSIPHGMNDMIKALTNSTDHRQWIDAVVKIGEDKDSWTSKWRYCIFHARNEKTTGSFYKIIKDHLRLDNIQALKTELSKIPGIRLPLELEEKRPSLIASS